jgi:hypothetical protein
VGTSRLAARLNAHLRAVEARRRRSPIDERPGCTFGAVTRQQTNDLAVVGRIEAKVNALLGGLALAISLEIVRSLVS